MVVEKKAAFTALIIEVPFDVGYGMLVWGVTV